MYARWVPGNTGGESETVLGAWMAARGNRQSVIIATKVMGPMGPGPNDTGLSRQHIIQGVEASLRRLRTDFIDVYQAHWDDRETPLAETLRAFDDLITQGKVRYLGASNYHAWWLTRAPWESDRGGFRALRVAPAQGQPGLPRRVRARARAAPPGAGHRRDPVESGSWAASV